MNKAVRYYTRSGNTKKLAEALAEALELKAESIDAPLTEKVDVLFLGCSYYAFDMDEKVKSFLKENKDNISEIVVFGSSAMMSSMKKPLKKVTGPLGIKIAEDEFHCRGKFKMFHKNRPNADDMNDIKKFAKKVNEKYN